MDAAGKDGTIKHVMSDVNPQGCGVESFKQPSAEELGHDFLWRCSKALPRRTRGLTPQVEKGPTALEAVAAHVFRVEVSE
jgi:Polyphosphate kinase 2 (PPK2)